MLLQAAQIISQIVFRTRMNCDRIIRELSRDVNNKEVLEIGSGKKLKGGYRYSYKRFFNKSNHFTRSDINPKFGHKVIDITRTKITNRYDMIICLNVLEHVYEFDVAIKNLHRVLKRQGVLIYFSPYIYPLHDIPHDYFRFSEYALRRLFSAFSRCEIKHFGLRRFPTGYYVKAVK